MTVNLRATFFWALFILLTFIVMLPPGWWVLAKSNFAYGLLHDHAGISEAIDRYAPRNEFRHDFELTRKEQRSELFRGIVQSIRHHGQGLEKLSYPDARGRQVPLLTEAEIIHLKDVANLLDTTVWIAALAFLLWLVWIAILYRKQITLPGAGQIVFSSLALLVIIAAILLLGPERVFNQLHVWVFPSDHQWFFYYEESLMSTMMKAPYLFAYIAIMWSLLSVFFTLLGWQLLKRLLNQPSR